MNDSHGTCQRKETADIYISKMFDICISMSKNYAENKEAKTFKNNLFLCQFYFNKNINKN